MIILLTILHVLVCFFLIVVVLLQSGKAADIAGAFGGMGSQTTFGPRGAATVLTKATTIAAGVFMLTSLTLAIMATRGQGGAGSGSVLERQAGTATQEKKGTTPAPVPPAGQPQVTVEEPGTGRQVTMPIEVPPQGQAGKAGQQAPAQQQQAPAEQKK
jgi:preprotein translocase subunit SecG